MTDNDKIQEVGNKLQVDTFEHNSKKKQALIPFFIIYQGFVLIMTTLLAWVLGIHKSDPKTKYPFSGLYGMSIFFFTPIILTLHAGNSLYTAVNLIKRDISLSTKLKRLSIFSGTLAISLLAIYLLFYQKPYIPGYDPTMGVAPLYGVYKPVRGHKYHLATIMDNP